jgi:hypothetical protein
MMIVMMCGAYDDAYDDDGGGGIKFSYWHVISCVATLSSFSSLR